MVEIDLSSDSPKRFPDTSLLKKRSMAFSPTRLSDHRHSIYLDLEYSSGGDEESSSLAAFPNSSHGDDDIRPTENTSRKKTSNDKKNILMPTNLPEEITGATQKSSKLKIKAKDTARLSKKLVGGSQKVATAVAENEVLNVGVSCRSKAPKLAVEKNKKLVMSMVLNSSFDDDDEGERSDLVTQLHLKEFTNFSFSEDSNTPGQIRWARVSPKSGSESKLIENDSSFANFVAVLFDPSEYIGLARQCNDQSALDFVALGARIDEILLKITTECSEGTKLTLILLDLEGAVNKQIKKEKKKPVAGQSTEGLSLLLDSASVFLLMDRGVSIVKYSTLSEIAEYLVCVTAQLLATLKSPSAGHDHLIKKSSNPSDEVKLQLTPLELISWKRRKMWTNMLSAIPGLSEARAKEIVKVYTCPRQLLDAYYNQTTTKEFKMNILKHVFYESEVTTSTRPNFDRKISKRAYEIFTSTDALSLFDDD